MSIRTSKLHDVTPSSLFQGMRIVSGQSIVCHSSSSNVTLWIPRRLGKKTHLGLLDPLFTHNLKFPERTLTRLHDNGTIVKRRDDFFAQPPSIAEVLNVRPGCVICTTHVPTLDMFAGTSTRHSIAVKQTPEVPSQLVKTPLRIRSRTSSISRWALGCAAPTSSPANSTASPSLRGTLQTTTLMENLPARSRLLDLAKHSADPQSTNQPYLDHQMFPTYGIHLTIKALLCARKVDLLVFHLNDAACAPTHMSLVSLAPARHPRSLISRVFLCTAIILLGSSTDLYVPDTFLQNHYETS